MTDRLAGYIVTLDHDIREDDAEVITKAIAQLKGVITVVPYKSNVDLIIGQERVRQELLNEIWDLIQKKKG